MDEKRPEISLYDLIETERNALGSSLVILDFVFSWLITPTPSGLLIFLFYFIQTKVTLESFLSWKKRKIQEKKIKLAEDEDQKKKDYKSGKQFGISGREMFSFNPELADDGPIEDGDIAFDSYARDDDEDNGETIFEYNETDLYNLALTAHEVGHK